MLDPGCYYLQAELTFQTAGNGGSVLFILCANVSDSCSTAEHVSQKSPTRWVSITVHVVVVCGRSWQEPHTER